MRGFLSQPFICPCPLSSKKSDSSGHNLLPFLKTSEYIKYLKGLYCCVMLGVCGQITGYVKYCFHPCHTFRLMNDLFSCVCWFPFIWFQRGAPCCSDPSLLFAASTDTTTGSWVLTSQSWVELPITHAHAGRTLDAALLLTSLVFTPRAPLQILFLSLIFFGSHCVVIYR